MKTRLWIFALLVIGALAAHLALLGPRVGHVAEETLNARRAVATYGLRAQMDLLDARLAPRVLASAPDLMELLKAPTDVTQPMPRPDERSLRAALTAAVSEPDLLIVANPQGAAVQRKGKGPAQLLPAAQVGSMPLARALLEGARPKPGFALVDGLLYRVAGASTPTNTGAVVVGALIDDALSSRLRTMLDADVTFFDGGRIAASSAPAAARPLLQAWIRHPSPGFGVLEIRLPVVGSRFTGTLPFGVGEQGRQAFRAALVSLDSGVQAAVSIPAAQQYAWLGRYQGLYLAALIGLFLFALIWGLIPAAPQPAPAAAHEPEPRAVPPQPVGEPISKPPPAPSAEPARAAGEEEPAGWDHLGEARTAEAQKAAEAQLEQAPQPDAAANALEAPEAEILEDHVSTEPRLPKPSNIELIDLTPVAEAQAQQKAQAEPPPATPEETAALAAELAPPEAPADHAEEPPPQKLTPAQEFSFAGLLDEAHETAASTTTPPPSPPPVADKPMGLPFGEEQRETTNPGQPSAALLAAMAEGETFKDFAHRQDQHAEYFPGDEPTRIEPVSAALLDKLRETDDESQTPRTVEHAPEKAAEPPPVEAPPADAPVEQKNVVTAPIEPAPAELAPPPAEESQHPGDEHTDEFAKHALEAAEAQRAQQLEQHHADAHAAEEWPEQTAPQAIPSWPELQQAAQEEAAAQEPPQEAPPPAQESQAVGDITLTNLQLPKPASPVAEEPAVDPDEQHWRDTFQKFLQTRAQTGEPSDKLSYEKFAAKLKKNREDLLARHGCRGVRFQVYVKEGKAAIKASAIK